MSCLPQIDEQILAAMAPEELRALTTQLLARIEQDAQRATQASQAIALRDAKIDKLSFELAQLRRIRFGVRANNSMFSNARCSRRRCKPTSQPSRKS